MEYSVGSLAELISGKHTPNKQKVVKKVITKVAPKTITKRKKTPLVEEEQPPTKKGKTKEQNKPVKSKNDLNAERRIKTKDKPKKEKIEDIDSVKARTLFVGNVPINTTLKKLKKHFSKYGSIESLRFRGVPVADPKTPKKVAAIRHEFHPDRNSILAYIKFNLEEDAKKALEENGNEFMGHHLRVQCSLSEEKRDESRAIFVGNLSFKTEEEALWNLFQPCGQIESVRIVRDPISGMGKGFGYINFKDSSSVELALEMEDLKLDNRFLRVSVCNVNLAKKNKKRTIKKEINKPGKGKTFKTKRTSGASNSNTSNYHGEFLGFKSTDKKKKKKVNKGEQLKKKLAKKIAPKG